MNFILIYQMNEFTEGVCLLKGLGRKQDKENGRNGDKETGLHTDLMDKVNPVVLLVCLNKGVCIHQNLVKLSVFVALWQFLLPSQ